MRSLGFPGGSDGKESSCNAGDASLIPGSGKSSGEENSTQLEYSCLENFMDRGSWWATVHGVAKSWTWMSEWRTCMYVGIQFSSVNENTLCFTPWKTWHLWHPPYWRMVSSADLAPPCAIFIQITTQSSTSNLCMWLLLFLDLTSLLWLVFSDSLLCFSSCVSLLMLLLYLQIHLLAFLCHFHSLVYFLYF